MKSSFKLATYLNAILIYCALFYSTTLFAETFSETFDVDLGGQLTVKTDNGSIKCIFRPNVNTYSGRT